MGKLTLRAYVGQRLDGLTEDMLETYAELLKKYPKVQGFEGSSDPEKNHIIRRVSFKFLA